MQIVNETSIAEYPLIGRGKVRDMYEIDDKTLLIVTTDRMSAFDVMMQAPVPYKGVVLNQMSLFWMERFKDLVPNHLLESDVNRFPERLAPYTTMLEGRSVLVKKANPIPVECIVRGHLSGSGWSDYQKTGTICGQPLPTGLVESDKLEPPLFTPSTKAELGGHDENINMAQAVGLVGEATANAIRDTSLRIFSEARSYAEQRGIIIADTKFEFGLIDGTVTLIDEALTPDSSRFWPMHGYTPGHGQPSFDKQYLRDWLLAQDWDRTPPVPALPAEVVTETARRYREAYKILTGKTLAVPY